MAAGIHPGSESAGTLASQARRHRVAMLLENNHYPADVRVRREAESLVGAGHRVCVIAPRGPGQARRDTVAGVEVRRFRLPPGGGGVFSFLLEYLVGTLALTLAAVRELALGADVIHLHNPPDSLFAAGLLARLLGRRVVFDHHDLFPELIEARYGPGLWVRLARAAERATFATSDLVLAPNESHAKTARDRGRKPAGSVTVVRNGPAEEWLRIDSPQRDGQLEDPHLLYLGAIAQQDGVEALAQVLSALVERHRLPAARLTIVGDGDARASVEAAMEAAGMSERVEITGWLGLEDVPARVGAADICLDPAPPNGVNERSTMIKIAEYMSLGKPVVAYDLLEARRTLGATGVLVPAGDEARFASAVAELAANPARRLKLGRMARERARTLTWEHSERHLLAAYERL